MSFLVTKENISRQQEIDAGVDSLVGNTPLIRLRSVPGDISPDVAIYAKAEWFNPGGSVKDRPALSILKDAVHTGKLTTDKRLLDSTSGNMGIAYATLGVGLDIKVTLAIPENASLERIKLLQALGAELILTDPLEGTDGAVRIAQGMAVENPERYFYANQYDNPANWEAHYRTTGPEIHQQTDGLITHFVAGMGTSGTMMGVSRYLRSQNPAIKYIAVQPDAPFHGLEGLKHLQTAIQPEIYDSAILDWTIEISTEGAHTMTRRLALEEGLFVGVSSGAAALAAIKLAEGMERGVIVTLFPDAGYKYLSEKFWEAKR